MHRGLVVATAVALCVVAAGCSHDGRELAEPNPALTAVPVPTTAPPGGNAAADAPAISVGADNFAISSARIPPGADIPRRFTCEGDDISPPLSFTAVPEGTAQLAIVMTDLDAGNFVHWAVRGIPPTLDHLEAGTLPADAVEMTNSFGVTNYRGPCPPRDTEHRYRFTLYALDQNAVELPVNQAGVVNVDDIVATNTAWVAGTFRGTEQGGNQVPGENGFSLTSSDIQPGGFIPEQYTCDGDDVSPPLTFQKVPPNTAALAVALTDEETGAIHWVVSGIPYAETVELNTGEVPEGAVVATNDFEHSAYEGPCLPDDEDHRFRFTAYALGTRVDADEGSPGGVLVDEFETNAITTASFAATPPEPPG